MGSTSVQHFLPKTCMSFISGPKGENFLFSPQKGVLMCWERQGEKAVMLFLEKLHWQTSTIILKKKKVFLKKENFADKVLRDEISAFISFCSLKGFRILLCSSFIPN